MILLRIDWHPWFSYEWWNDIGVPALGAIGSIAVGAGAIAVALHSNRIAKNAAQDAAASRASEKASADRAARFKFGELVNSWFETEILARSAAPESPSKRHLDASAADLKKDLDLRAANIGQSGGELVGRLQSKARQIPSGDSPKLRQAAGLMSVIGFDAVRAWIDSPQRWLEMEEASEAFQRKWNGEFDPDNTDWGFERVSHSVYKRK